MLDVVYPRLCKATGISNGYTGATLPYPSIPWFHGDCPVRMAALAGVHVGVDENAFAKRNPSSPSLSRLGVLGFPPSKIKEHHVGRIAHVGRQLGIKERWRERARKRRAGFGWRILGEAYRSVHQILERLHAIGPPSWTAGLAYSAAVHCPALQHG